VIGGYVCNKVNRRWRNSNRHLPVGRLVTCLLLLTVWGPAASGRVLYVNASLKAGEAMNGTSWDRAFRDLQDALAVAHPGDEIWIAAGTYRPDRGTGDRDMSFTVEGGIALYGGFSGRETERKQRDWARNETLLTGDLNGDDGPPNCGEVSNCCVEHDEYSCDDAECELRVCNIWPGCCDEQVGRTHGWDDQCTYLAKLECCHLGSWHSCENSRVVVRIPDGDEPTVIDGLHVSGAYDAVPIGEIDAFSAGVHLAVGSLTLRNSTIADNARVGVYSQEDAPKRIVSVESCRFANNVGGSGLQLYSHGVSVSDSLFERNYVGMHAHGAEVVRCVFSDNFEAASLGGTGNVVEDSWFIGNENGLSISGLGASSTVSRCYFIQNWGAGLAVATSKVSDCVFRDNGHFGLIGGGLATTDVRRCVIMGTGKGTEHGGSFAILGEFGGLILRDSLVVGNWTYGGGAVGLDDANAVIRNTVIADNRKSSRRGTGIWARLSNVVVENSIVWGNQDRDGIAENTQVGLFVDSTIEINNSIVQDWSGVLGGMGNSGNDPLFVDPLGPDALSGTGDEDFRLSPDSPAIDAGDPGFVPFSGQTDLDGFPRLLCGRVDIGAYEFGIGDHNCDRVIDLSDFSAWESCMTGPLSTAGAPWTPYYPTGCESFDPHYDGDVDLEDYKAILNMHFGP